MSDPRAATSSFEERLPQRSVHNSFKNLEELKAFAKIAERAAYERLEAYRLFSAGLQMYYIEQERIARQASDDNGMQIEPLTHE